MYIFFIGFFLIASQVICHGAPERLFPVPQRPADVSREEKYMEKRDCKQSKLKKNVYSRLKRQ